MRRVAASPDPPWHPPVPARPRRARWRPPLLSLLVLLLVGCQQVELYSNLSETEGNDILSVLLTNGIPAAKTRAKEFVTIQVPKDQVSVAIDLLRAHGLPRERFTDLGQIFQKQGLISSPMEERVRYTYGLSQMLAETINRIDGVLTARVLIVLPEEAQFGKPGKPSSASVFIRYLPGLSVEDSVPRIKMLVQNSVDGLSYDNISVALFPRQDPGPLPPLSSAQPTGDAGAAGASPWPMLAMALGALLLLTLAGGGYLLQRSRVRPTGHADRTMP